METIAVEVDALRANDVVTHTPLYNLSLGVSESSYGLSCARIAGVSEEVIKRASEIKKSRESHTLLPPHSTIPQPPSLPSGSDAKKAYTLLLDLFLPNQWDNASEETIDKLMDRITQL